MALINRQNFLSVLGVTFMITKLAATLIEIVIWREINPHQHNTLALFFFCIIGIGVLSRYHLLSYFSPLIVMIILYFIAMALVLFYTWLTGFWEPVHPNGYRDMARSFSVLYLVGSVIYYINLKWTIKKQNEDIQLLKKLSEQQ